MADDFNRYLDGPRRSLPQYLAELVEQFDHPPLTGPLLARFDASTSRVRRASSRRRRS